MPHLVSLLLRAAERAPQRGMTVPDGTSRSWLQLLEAAWRAAGGLRAAGLRPGDPLLLLLADISDFFPIFWGALLAGATPVPLAGPRNPSRGERERIARVLGLLGGPLAVLDRGMRAPLPRALDAGHLLQGEPLRQERAPVQDAPALIQFSSGSTGHPRGVALSHGNLLANVAQMARAYDISPDDRKLTWMPHYHDMGLIGCHLLPLQVGMDEVRLDAVQVFRDPLSWLRAAQEHGASLLSSTNTMMDRLNRRLARNPPRGLDLSALRYVFNGAEPISPQVCREFCRLTGLPQTVHYPLYGLAEASVGVAAPRSGGLRTRRIQGRDVVEIGPALPEVQLRVVDERDRPLPEGAVGQLQFRGPNAFVGYWKDPQATAAARCGPWVRTGDLACLHEGVLAVTGRHKDVICVQGRNLHAHDVEAAAEACEGVRSNGAVAIADRRGEVEQLALCLLPERDCDSAPVLWAARQAVTRATGVQPSLVLPLEAVPRTTSGKKCRTLLAEALQRGELDGKVGNTLEAVRLCWQAALGREIGPQQLELSFADLGGGSIEAMDVLLRLEARFGLLPDHRILLQGESVRAMALLLERHPPRGRALPTARGQRAVGVVAAACHLPGARSPAELWQLATQGSCQIGPPPAGRWDARGAGFSGGFVQDVDRFDGVRFGIPHDEAAAMDPQQRLLLELCADLVAGAELQGRQVGVFVGAGQLAYQETVLQQLDQPLPPGTMAGNLLNMLAARIAHHLDLRGPALTVDTACSASLVAVHLACRSLATGECDAALVAGVNLNLTPSAHRLFQLAGALSPSGRCLPFSAEADGTVPGEGAVALLLEPLRAARARGAPLLGVLHGSAINNDGASLGVMAPNPAGQEAVIRQALAAARCDPAEIVFVEAHGTGTAIGDPVERSVLRRCYPQQPRLGAIKGQIGHLLGAAGIAGLLRALGELAPGEKGAVSSFGFGGTNAHLVLEGGQARQVPPLSRRAPGPRRWLGEPDATDWVHLVRRDPAGGLQFLPCPQASSPLRAGGSYLLTGGAGALGSQLALHLARRFGARLLLVGRSPEGPQQRALLARLAAAGGQARYLRADLAVADQAPRVQQAAGWLAEIGTEQKASALPAVRRASVEPFQGCGGSPAPLIKR